MQKILRIDEALKNIKSFKKIDGFLLSNKDYKELKTKAKRLYNYLGFNELDSFENQACFTSSSALSGFYFPNLNCSLDVIIFDKIGNAIAVIDDEE